MRLSILVIDLVGYSERLAALEEQVENAGETLNRQIEQFVSNAIAAAQLDTAATVVKFTGDGAILKAPNAERAHRIAVALQEASVSFNQGRKTVLGQRVFRVGIASGEVAEYASLSGATDHGGSTIGRAARMEAGCKPGGITVDEETFRALPLDLRLLYSQAERLTDKNGVVYAVHRFALAEMPRLSGADSLRQSPVSADVDSGLLDAFAVAMLRLFGRDGPLRTWSRFLPAQSESELPPAICAVLTVRDRGLGDRLTRLTRHDIAARLAEDLRESRISLSVAERRGVRAALVEGMDAAIGLCMDQAKRQQLAQTRLGLLPMPARQTEGAALAMRPNPVDWFELKPDSPHRAMRAKYMAEWGLESGVGKAERYGIASLVCSIPSERNPEGRAVQIGSEREVEEWRGFLNDERERGRERLLVLGASQVDAVGDEMIAWIERLGVRVLRLVGDDGTFWWLEESLLVGRVSGFIEDLNRISG